jgi:hypothetical protein
VLPGEMSDTENAIELEMGRADEQFEELDDETTVDVIRHKAEQEDKVLYNNALRENIESKGKNSYYYAHGTQRDAPEWDGKEEPRLLHVTTDVATSSKPKTVSIPSYMWADCKKTVKVYIETEFLDGLNIEAQDISVSHTEKSVSITITAGDKIYEQHIFDLNDSISAATFALKPDKIVVTLQKVEEHSWYKLSGK